MLFSSLCLCRFIDFWSTSLSNSGFCRAIDRSARWCVCVQDYTYFTWYVVSQSQFFSGRNFLEVHLDRAPRDEIREISIEQTSRSRHPCSREIRDGVRTCTYVRTLMYAVVSRYIHRYTYRTYVVTSYWPDLDPRSRVKSLISTNDLEWNLGYLGCEMISSHLDLEGWFSISSRSRRGARDEIEMHL